MKQRMEGYERREKREGEKEEWITLRQAVMRCAVLCCTHFLFYICCSKAVTFHNVFCASCSCFKHFIYIYRYRYVYIFIDICMRMYIYIYMCVCVCVCVFVCVVCVCVCDCVCMCGRRRGRREKR